jgi:hypothetical protein
MPPIICCLAIVHCTSAAQAEKAPTNWTNGLSWRSRIGDDLFPFNCLGNLHSPSISLLMLALEFGFDQPKTIQISNAASPTVLSTPLLRGEYSLIDYG